MPPPDEPTASRVPFTVTESPELTLTVTPSWIVSVTPLDTVMLPVTM
jgi:hypothetical protein